MTEATGGDDERARPNSRKKKNLGQLEEAIRKPIRPQVIRPQPLAATDRKTIERANAQMEELHEKAVATARREKLKLLLRRYSLAEDDYEGLALALAIAHEPGFQVDRQIVELPPGFSGLVRVKDGILAPIADEVEHRKPIVIDGDGLTVDHA
jgi:hypothetical protein